MALLRPLYLWKKRNLSVQVNWIHALRVQREEQLKERWSGLLGQALKNVHFPRRRSSLSERESGHFLRNDKTNQKSAPTPANAKSRVHGIGELFSKLSAGRRSWKKSVFRFKGVGDRLTFPLSSTLGCVFGLTLHLREGKGQTRLTDW